MELAILCFFTARLNSSEVDCLLPHSTHKLPDEIDVLGPVPSVLGQMSW
jgi:hypothetical protein